MDQTQKCLVQLALQRLGSLEPIQHGPKRPNALGNHEPKFSRRSQNLRHLHVVAEAWNLQNLLKGYNHCENPLSSDAWKELHLVGEVYDIRIDQCALGLRCPKTNKPVYKPTRIVTTSPELARELQKYRCDRNHDHGHLEYKGKNLSAWGRDISQKVLQSCCSGNAS